MKKIEDTIRRGLFEYYNKDRPQVHYNPREIDRNHPTSLLVPYADIYEYALLDGRRITPTTRSTRNKAGSSIVQAWFKNGAERVACVGEVRAIFVHRQPEIPHSDETALIVVEWLVESDYTPLNANSFIWDTKLCVNIIHPLSAITEFIPVPS
jgi:hypothetical protein